ncbi:MAG TPA: GNAT family N-acetyltransferase [Steroidobacteraceae bacterium]|nr:GNAT family N-acetyltransferase [Steroidobacteraceae bacterium]
MDSALAEADVHELARRMRDLSVWLDAEKDIVAERTSGAGSPHGTAYLTLDAASQAPAASRNSNRILLCGTEGGLTQAGLAQLLERFTRRGIGRVFAWLSPGPELQSVRDWLAALSFSRVPWTRYPTLLHSAPAEPPRAHPFQIREVDAEAFSAARGALGEAVMEGYAHTLGKPGMRHYVAYDADRPVAAAALACRDGLGYLTFAGTLKSERRRGAQSALIAHRVAVAQALGCTRIVSRTLTMLEDSLANLQRGGFREVFEQEVYEYRRE